jgi:hypothetical protein
VRAFAIDVDVYFFSCRQSRCSQPQIVDRLGKTLRPVYAVLNVPEIFSKLSMKNVPRENLYHRWEGGFA